MLMPAFMRAARTGGLDLAQGFTGDPGPASRVLDDTLVFADGDRFETTTDILAEAASRRRIHALSCPTSACRHVVEATRLTLTRRS
jgi:hypothetical protein